MTTVFIDRRDAQLSLKGDAIDIRAGDQRMTLPVGQIERLVIRSPATVDTSLLARCWSQGTGVLVLSGRRGEATARLLGRPSNDAARRVAQALVAADAALALQAARPIVSAKVSAQVRTLERLAHGRPAVAEHAVRFRHALKDITTTINAAVSLDALRGIEGAAARAYWAGLQPAFAPSLGFAGRNRRPPRDPVNATLSLAYTIATFEAATRAQIAGLDPMIGTLHALSFGRDSLACDLVEPLRPRLDLWVNGLFRERQLRVEHFSTNEEGACLLGKAGRAAFYEALDLALPAWARWLDRAARQQTRAFRLLAANKTPMFLEENTR
jgi:CRISPR-associated protein Cas1